ncbi:MAG: cytochrome C, partial [Seleniivibrio sp.]|nr:cytochrome C [Seleniivibrio sp.]
NEKCRATYMDTFHGKAVEFGMPHAPSCIDCHVKKGDSAHNIQSWRNPISATYEKNRYKTCEDADCHANASQQFGMIRMHSVIDKDIYPVEFYVALGFTILTIGAFYPLLALMILELIREMFPNFSLRRKKKD